MNDTYAQFPDGVKRHTIVGTVDANTGDYVRFRLDESSPDVLANKAASSASLPGLFPPQHIDGRVLIDGGTAMGLDAVSAIEKCLEIVDDES